MHVPDHNPTDCDVTVDGPNIRTAPRPTIRRASTSLYPRQCTLDDLAGAAAGKTDKVARLRQCGLNYELHHNGYLEQWPDVFWQNDPDLQGHARLQPIWQDVLSVRRRSRFTAAGVVLQRPRASDSGLSVYERVYNASIFSLYLPVANVADIKRAFHGPQLHR